MTRSITRLALGIVVSLAATSASRAANDVWDNTPLPPGDIRWENGTNWTDGTTPGNVDTATFNLPLAIQVSFVAPPAAIQALTVSAPVLFQSSGGAKTLSVTSASGGQDVTISAAILALGTAGNPMHLTVGDDLTVRGGAVLNVTSGSQVNTLDLLLATVNGGGNGTVVVDGTGSTLNATTTTTLGTNGASGTLIYSNAAQGALSTAGTVNVGVSSFSTTVGTLGVASNADVNVGNLNIGTGASSTGVVNVQGSGSTLDLMAASTLTVGSAAGGSGSLDIGTTASGGTLTTGTGLFTINATGTVSIGAGGNTGTLNANGNVTINGGVLQLNNFDSTFALAAGKTMTVQNGGRATFSREFNAANNGVYNISGANSKLETIGVDPEDQFNRLEISSGSQVNVSSGGLVSSAGFLDMGRSGNGTLSVDGNGSSVVSAADIWSTWGHDGGVANVTFTNNATGMFNGGITMAASPGSTANVNILSGADLTVGVLFVAFSAGETTSAALNVQGNGSTVTQTGASAMIAGHVTGEGIAEIYIGTEASGAVFTTGTGHLTINKNSFIVIGDDDNTGTLNANGNVTIDGGKLYKLNPGSTFNMASGKTMTIQNGGWFRFDGDFTTAANAIYNIRGSSLLETVYGSPIIGNGATVNVTGTLYSWGGDLSIGTVGNGTLSVDGSNSFVSARLSALWGANGATATVTFSNNASGSLYDADLDLAGDSDAGTTAIVSVQSGADLNVHNLSLATAGGATTSATLTVDGAGSTVTQTEAATLTVGHSATGMARLVVKNNGVFTTGTGGVTVRSTGQINIESGGIFDAYGTININGGAFNFLGGTLHADTFNGNLLNQGGTLAPGHSVGSTTIVGNYTQQAGATLEIEIGGLSAGSGHDLLGVTGNAILGGELQLALIDFVPVAANTFTILNATGLFGVFSNVTTGQRLTTIDGIGSFLVHYGAGSVFNNNQIVLTAFELVALPGDFNSDGAVDAADYAVWRNGLGTTFTPTDYDVWRAHFGESSGNIMSAGATGSASANSTVPEPATAGLALVGLVVLACRRGRGRNPC